MSRLVWVLVLLVGCTTNRRDVRRPIPPVGSLATGSSDPLAMEAWVALAVEDVEESAEAVRIEAKTRGGKVIAEDSSGRRGAGGETTLQVRLPPEQLEGFLAWLERLGDVSSRRLQAVDASKTVSETDIALDNLELTLGRLRDLAGRPGIGLPELLQLEREMERVRGDIEKAKAEKRRLGDRVAMAAVEVDLQEPEAPFTGSARAKLYPGPRAVGMLLIAPGEREAMRAGGGVTLHFSRGFTFELDVFQGPAAESVSAFATIGGSIYSDFLGRGRRKFLNPYLGLRMGYGWFESSHFLLAGELGLELFKHKHILIETNVRMLGMLSKDPNAALVGGLGFVIAF